MLNMGLIRGASRENCIVLTPDGIDNPPLRYSDEFGRHKCLNLIGDLALFGKHHSWHVKADRAGHAMQPPSFPAFCAIPPTRKKSPSTKRGLPSGRPTPSPPPTSF